MTTEEKQPTPRPRRRPEEKPKPADIKPPPRVSATQTEDSERTWDEVDEASWESFPASDPPARWAGTDQPQAKPVEVKAEPTKRPAPAKPTKASAKKK